MINVLFFVRLREQLNCEKIELELELEHNSSEPLTITDVKNKLIELQPAWQPHFNNSALLTAINQQMCDHNTPITNGDEVAFFPPVTGG